MPDSLDRLTTALSARYTIERELGAGGMATVYLAEDLKHKRKVAVKVLRPELAAVLGAERFVQEITTTANLQHPHILPLFDSGEADGFLYYVMPFIDGETLRDKLDRETQLSIDEAVQITCDVADALDYAHRHSVIHRDIKPENILLHDGRPMVADFGIALAVSAAAGGRMTETGLSLGTPHYMSPEQATAEKNLTNRADIYSLGSVLYEMLTGSPPHVGSTAQQIIMKIVTDQARSVAELRKTVPPNVASATAKALEKLPADRFASAGQFAEALANPAAAPLITTAAGASAPLAPGGLARLITAFAVGAILVWLVKPSAGAAGRYDVGLSPDAPLVMHDWSLAMVVAPQGDFVVYRAGSDDHTGLSPFSVSRTGDLIATDWTESRIVQVGLSEGTATVEPLVDDGVFGVLSTDDRWLAFQPRGLAGILVSPYPSLDRREQIARDVFEPQWLSPTELVFWEQGGTFYRATIDPASGRLVGSPTVWHQDSRFSDTPGHSFTLTADGDLVYVQEPEQRPAAYLRVIPNWVGHMKRTVEEANR